MQRPSSRPRTSEEPQKERRPTVHAALDAQAGAHPPARRVALLVSRPASLARAQGTTLLSVAALMIAVSLSMADGLLGGNVVAFERDTSAFYFPLMSWVHQELGRGELPLWAPGVFGGYPIFADGEIGLAYPPVVLALLILPTERAFLLLRLAHLAIAALGTFLLARAWRLPHSSAILAGVVFALGSFLQAQIHHENIVRTAAWLPLMLGLAERALRASPTARTAWTAAGALAVGMAGLSLHTQLLATDLLVLGAYGALRLWVGPVARAGGWWRARLIAIAGVFAPVALLGMALAATQLLPLAELARFSPRGGGIPYEESAAYSLTPYSLVQLVFPFFFRTPTNEQWGLWTHWEAYLYVGLAPLVLTLVAVICVRRRDIALWSALGSVGLVFALGQYSPLNLHHVLWLLPGMAGLRAPGRFTLVVVLAAAMLSAYGLAWLRAAAQDGLRPSAARRFRSMLAGMIALPFILALGLVVAHQALQDHPDEARLSIERWYLHLPHDSYPLTPSDVYSGLLGASDLSANTRTGGALVGLLLVGLALTVWHAAPWSAVRGWTGWPSLLVAGSTADLLLFGWSVHPRDSLAHLTAAAPAAVAVQHLAEEDSMAGPSRVLASPVASQLTANRLVPLGLQEVGGYSSLEPRWHDAYLRRILQVDDALLDLWNVRYVFDPAQTGPLASYRGVTFLPQQTLLHAVGGGALASASFRLDPTTVRAMGLVTALVNAIDLPQGAQVGEVELRGATGDVVATYPLLAGRDTMEWARSDPVLGPRVKHGPAEVAGLTFEPGASAARLLSYGRFTIDPPTALTAVSVRATLPHGELLLFGGAVEGADGAEQQLAARRQDKYREVYRDTDVAVFQNTAAFPRAFVVPEARAMPSLEAAQDAMIRAPFNPSREVILSPSEDEIGALPGGHKATPDSGRPSPASVEGLTADAFQLRVATPTDGFLVVSDTYYPGWRAWVDGQEQPVLRGDLLFRVVRVPAGEHVVRFAFDPASVKVGLLVSVAALTVIIGMFGSGLGKRRGAQAA